VPAVEDSVSWHDTTQRKRSLCQENAVLLAVYRFGVKAPILMVFGLILALPTLSFSLLFFRLHLRATFRG